MDEEEVITVSRVCKNVFHVPYKPKEIHLQNLKNSFREVYLCLSPHRMFSITEEEWSIKMEFTWLLANGENENGLYRHIPLNLKDQLMVFIYYFGEES